MDTKLQQYIVNAFSKGKYTGNPAAVCPLKQWLEDDLMQNIAMQNNLSETAFFVKTDDRFHIRWFTPNIEVDLCGHATLASAFVIFNKLDYNKNTIEFTSRSGPLSVTKVASSYQLDFPTDQLLEITCPELLTKALGSNPIACYQAKDDLLLRFTDQESIEALKPDFSLLKEMGGRGVIVTAPGKKYDFVSRCFYPAAGIDEDPATGSAHTTLTPHWYSQTSKTSYTAVQLSQRRGYFECHYANERILITGDCDLFSEGSIYY